METFENLEKTRNNSCTPQRRDVFNDVSQVSKMIHLLTGDNETDEVICPPSEDSSCAHCGKNNVQLLQCSKCSSLVCADCFVDTIEGKTLCTTCWEESDNK